MKREEKALVRLLQEHELVGIQKHPSDLLWSEPTGEFNQHRLFLGLQLSTQRPFDHGLDLVPRVHADCVASSLSQEFGLPVHKPAVEQSQ